MTLYSISSKKRIELYNIIHEDILKARIEIAKILKEKIDKNQCNKIENILFRLHVDAPQNVINFFKKK